MSSPPREISNDGQKEVIRCPDCGFTSDNSHSFSSHYGKRFHLSASHSKKRKRDNSDNECKNPSNNDGDTTTTTTTTSTTNTTRITPTAVTTKAIPREETRLRPTVKNDIYHIYHHKRPSKVYPSMSEKYPSSQTVIQNVSTPVILLRNFNTLRESQREFYSQYYSVVITERIKILQKYNRRWQGNKGEMYTISEKQVQPDTFFPLENGQVSSREEEWFNRIPQSIQEDYDILLKSDRFYNDMILDPLFSLRSYPTYCWGFDFSDIFDLFKMSRFFKKYRQTFQNSVFVNTIRNIYPHLLPAELLFKKSILKQKKARDIVLKADKALKIERREERRKEMKKKKKIGLGTTKRQQNANIEWKKEDDNDGDETNPISSPFSSISSSFSSSVSSEDAEEDSEDEDAFIEGSNGVKIRRSRDPDLDNIELLSKREWLEILLPRVARTENEMRERRIYAKISKSLSSFLRSDFEEQAEEEKKEAAMLTEIDKDVKKVEKEEEKEKPYTPIVIEDVFGSFPDEMVITDDNSDDENENVIAGDTEETMTDFIPPQRKKRKISHNLPKPSHKPVDQHRERILPIVLLPFFLDSLHSTKKDLNPIMAMCMDLKADLEGYRNTLVSTEIYDHCKVASLELTITQFAFNFKKYSMYKEREYINMDYAYNNICEAFRRTESGHAKLAGEIDKLKMDSKQQKKDIKQLKKEVDRLKRNESNK